MFKFFTRFASRARNSKTKAMHALERADYGDAEARFDILLDVAELTPTERAFLLNKRGVARVGGGRCDAAASDFEAALQAHPRFAPALTNLGNLLLEAGQPEAAMRKYNAAIAADDEYAVAYLNLAVAYRRLGQLAQSVRALRKAQRLEGRIRWKPSKRA